MLLEKRRASGSAITGFTLQPRACADAPNAVGLNRARADAVGEADRDPGVLLENEAPSIDGLSPLTLLAAEVMPEM